jgi:predicted Fe-Mo cluster-binding NifX family protein
MIYAIAMSNDKLSHQFSKSESFAFYSENKQLIAVHNNPALGKTGCSAKFLIVQLLQQMKCDTVIVRKIGEKTLAKLLSAGLKVELGNTRNNVEQLLESAKQRMHSLTLPEQGIQKSCEHKEHDHQCCGKH